MLEPRQIRELTIKGLRGKKKAQLDQYLAQIADFVEELIAENNSIKADNVGLDDVDAFRQARISELEEKNAALVLELTKAQAIVNSCEQTQKEHQALMDVLQKAAVPAAPAPGETVQKAEKQAEEILARARQQADLLVEQGRKEYISNLRRAEEIIARKAEDFQNRLRADVARWRAADADLREMKATLTKMANAMPDGVDACLNKSVRQLWDSLGSADKQ